MIFLPGGPGLGSEYWQDFIENAASLENRIILDYPGDGSNTQPANQITINNWQTGLLDLVQQYSNPILVAHSFGGMLALSIPELENYLHGIVLLNTAPCNDQGKHLIHSRHNYGLPDFEEEYNDFLSCPCAEHWQYFIESYVPYFFTKDELIQGTVIVEQLSLSWYSYSISERFYESYKAQWTPQHIPCLIIDSSLDYICNPTAFIKKQEFNRPNIQHSTILNAGHFPWLLYGETVLQMLLDFSNK